MVSMFISLAVGLFVGVVVMCLMQIVGRIERMDEREQKSAKDCGEK